jgi:hypothetical protein
LQVLQNLRKLQIVGSLVPSGRLPAVTRPPDIASGAARPFGGNQVSETKEIVERLNRLLKTVSRVIGLDIEVEESGDHLIFIDAGGEPITNDGEEIIAATPQELEAKTFLVDFPVRAFRAGMMAKYQDISRARSEP